MGVETHDSQASTDYESDVLPTAPHRPYVNKLIGYYDSTDKTLQLFVQVGYCVCPGNYSSQTIFKFGRNTTWINNVYTWKHKQQQNLTLTKGYSNFFFQEYT